MECHQPRLSFCQLYSVSANPEHLTAQSQKVYGPDPRPEKLGPFLAPIRYLPIILAPQRTFRAVLTRPKPSFPHQHFLCTMADSDEEYIGAISEDEGDDNVVRGSRGAAGPASKRRKQKGGAEFELSRTWETLVEGADGTISSTVEGLLEASKRKRLVTQYHPFVFQNKSHCCSHRRRSCADSTCPMKALEGHNTTTARHNTPCCFGFGLVTVNDGERPAANAVSFDSAICTRVCERVL